MKPGDLVRILPTWDVEKNYPQLARGIGVCVELKPCTTYPGNHMALIHTPPHRPKWWPLEVWAEDLEVLSEAG
jgi:hypothetical protein